MGLSLGKRSMSYPVIYNKAYVSALANIPLKQKPKFNKIHFSMLLSCDYQKIFPLLYH